MKHFIRSKLLVTVGSYVLKFRIAGVCDHRTNLAKGGGVAASPPPAMQTHSFNVVVIVKI